MWYRLNRLLMVVGILGLLAGAVRAQEASVPDLTGLNIPQAAAALNRAGLRLGQEDIQPWSESASVPPGVVASQGIAAGSSVAPAAAVDVTVFSGTKIRLIYDDNDLTLINDSSDSLPLGSLSFNSADGGHRFQASRWRGDLPAGDCTQIWSVGRNGSKDVEGCGSTYWLVTTNNAEHFWTQVAGVQSFSVIQDGSVRATCDGAPANSQDQPTTCEFYVASGALAVAATPYIYFAYTADQFAVINNSSDRWMPLTETTIYNFNPAVQVQGAGLNLSAPGLFPGDAQRVASTQRLAPGQCILLTLDSASPGNPPQPCDVIAQLALSSQVIFWSADFQLDSTLNPTRSTCPAATPGQLTLCIMPR